MKKLTIGLSFFLLVFILSVTSGFSTTYDFNDGTNQGWTYEVYGAPSNTLLSSGFTGWSDINNYPNVRTDPALDNNGSATVGLGAASSALPGDTDLYIQFLSPDLSGMTDWQDIDAFSMQILQSFDYSIYGPFEANLALKINDTTGGGSTERMFFSSYAGLNNDSWTSYDFNGIQTLLSGGGVSSYTTLQVWTNIHLSADALGLPPESVFSIDNVTPGQGSGPGPGVIPEPATMLLFGLGLLGVAGVSRRKKIT